MRVCCTSRHWRLDGPERRDGITLEDEDEKVGDTKQHGCGIHNVNCDNVGPFDCDAKKEETLEARR